MKMEITQIMRRVADYNCPLVEITGGEPLLQNETPLLISKLLENGYVVMMETNGSFDISRVDERCVKIVDIKCPSSNESEKNDLGNLQRLHPKDQIKFVIGNREDYIYAKNIIMLHCPEFLEGHILFSPASGIMSPADLAGWILEDNLNVRLHVQLHKTIWPDKNKGV
jgi:7-carboxy-7-deazaguanine synthase